MGRAPFPAVDLPGIRHRAGIGKVRFHDTRHTWATRLGLAGVPAQALQAMGGWSSLALVTHYTRASSEQALATLKNKK